jgi:hypothetical protein
MSLESTISKNAATTLGKHELICFGSHGLWTTYKTEATSS